MRNDLVSFKILKGMCISYNRNTSKNLVFRGYTDGTFSVVKSSSDPYLGFLGPLLTVEQGDIVKVVFLNRADRPLSLHPHGLRVGKPYEGIFYNDDEIGKFQLFFSTSYKGVIPKKTHLY